MKAESKELPVDTMELQMGPSHPATHGTIKFNLKLEGEKRWVSLRISTRGLRTIEKNGIEAVVAKLRSQGVRV